MAVTALIDVDRPLRDGDSDNTEVRFAEHTPGGILARLAQLGSVEIHATSHTLRALAHDPAAPMTVLDNVAGIFYSGAPLSDRDAEEIIEIFGVPACFVGQPTASQSPAPTDPISSAVDFDERVSRCAAVSVTAARVAQFAELVDYATAVSVLRCLDELGVIGPDRSLPAAPPATLPGLPDHLRTIVPRWWRLLDASKVTRAAATPGTWQPTIEITDAVLADAWAAVRAVWSPELGTVAFIDYLQANATRLSGLVRGTVHPLSLMFPDGGFHVAQAMYAEAATARYANHAVAEFISDLSAAAARPLRILEAGAGSGATTEIIVDRLARSGPSTTPESYHFTDLSQVFLDDARRRYGRPSTAGESAPTRAPWMRFALFDLDSPAHAQGFAAATYDVVVAAGVLNNVKHLPATLAVLAHLLRPGGWLAITEPTAEQNWLYISQAFMMSAPTDERSAAAVTFVGRDQWHTMLDNAGFVATHMFPPPTHPLAALDQTTIFAQRLDREPNDRSASPAAAGGVPN